jgi:GNAT superfamily N-acetyltransferase
VIVAAGRDRRPGRSSRIRAGFVCEYYARSGAALGTYLTVAPGVRRRGLARRLVELGRQVLAVDAGQPGGPGPVLFAETEKPERSPHESPADVAARLAALARLGFLRSELPYVQPPLGRGKPPVDRMVLLVHGPSLAATAADGAGSGAPAVSGGLVESFLRDFYESLGAAPDRSPAFQAMRRWLAARDPVPLLPLAPLNPVTPATARAVEPPRE